MASSLSPWIVPALLVFTATPPLLAQDLVFKGAGSKATLVELYSSEGCSSCPPAEAWLGALKTSPALWTELFPLAFHVDYWDGLGWPDRFARPNFTQRQKDYATRLGQDSVYTPEFVADGREWRGWFDGRPLPAAAAVGGELTLVVQADGRKVTATYSPASGKTLSAGTLNLALLGSNLQSKVKRGENAGRDLTQDFVVLDFVSQPLAVQKGGRIESGPVDLVSSTGDPPAAVVGWISTPAGSLVQIAGGWLKTPGLVDLSP